MTMLFAFNLIFLFWGVQMMGSFNEMTIARFQGCTDEHQSTVAVLERNSGNLSSQS
jgi:hypothetical protein